MTTTEEIKLLLRGISSLSPPHTGDRLERYQNLVGCLLDVLYRRYGQREADRNE
jgi:hypothetical protein